MKTNKLLLISLIILAFSTCVIAQKDTVLNFEMSKADIYSKSLLWVAKTWKSANDVVQLKDEHSGLIMVKGGLATHPLSLGMPGKGVASTQLNFTIKDGRVKIEFSETNFKWGNGSVWCMDKLPSITGKQYYKWKENTLIEMDSLISSYSKSLLKSDDF